MSRKWRIDGDEDRLPEGMRRDGYDADTQTYTYGSFDGSEEYQGQPGQRYGELTRTRTTRPVRAPEPSAPPARGRTARPDNAQASTPARSRSSAPPRPQSWASAPSRSNNTSARRRSNNTHGRFTFHDSDEDDEPAPAAVPSTTRGASLSQQKPVEPTPPPPYRTPSSARKLTHSPSSAQTPTRASSSAQGPPTRRFSTAGLSNPTPTAQASGSRPPPTHDTTTRLSRRNTTFGAILDATNLPVPNNLSPRPRHYPPQARSSSRYYPPPAARPSSYYPPPARSSSTATAFPRSGGNGYPRRMDTVPARVPELQRRTETTQTAGRPASTDKMKRRRSFAGAILGLSKNVMGLVKEAAIAKVEKLGEELRKERGEVKERRKGGRRRY